MVKLKINKNIRKIHFIGIGGVSMSALAGFCIHAGYSVSGSDLSESEFTLKLKNSGAKISIGHKAGNVRGAELVVFNSAIKEDNPELIYAVKNSIEIMERNKFLKLIADNFKNVIAVSGSHGKTSTTALISEIFFKCGKTPGMHLGGVSNYFNSNLVTGKKNFFITEACEYKRNFLSLNPDIAIILNIDEDHPDYYKDLTDIKLAFKDFSLKIKNDGKVIINADDINSDIFSPSAVTVGVNDNADYRACNITEASGKYSFDLYKKDEFKGKVNLNVYGYHNIHNALFGFAAADFYKLNTKKVIEAINGFKGVSRRFENIGEINGVKVISDYAHHPKEICASLASAKTLNQKVTCVFQSHTYSRTKKLLKDFAECFLGCDVVLTDIYAAREELDTEVFSNLIKECKNYADSVIYIEKEKVFAYLKQNIHNGIILILGAGDLHFVINDNLKDN